MAYQRYFEDEARADQPACIHLRSKSMYVTGEMKPNHPDENCEIHCWCNQSQHVLGPDQKDVDRTLCIIGRDCFRETR